MLLLNKTKIIKMILIIIIMPYVCKIIYYRRSQNMVTTSVKRSAAPRMLFFLFVPHFDLICDLLLTEAWSLLVLYDNKSKMLLMMTSSMPPYSKR